MKNIKRIKNYLIIDKYNEIEWICLSVITLLFFFTLYYGDNIGMFLIYFWKNDLLLSLNSVFALGDNQLPYGIVQQLFCELWALPVNLVYKIRPFNVANTFTVLWYKASMVFVFGLVIREIDKIAHKLGIDDKSIKWLRILLISTITVALPVYHIAQSDVIYLYLVLLAIRLYFEEKYKWMIFAFALAISCKYIAVFAFIPLILLTEKRIFRIIRDCVLGVSLIPLQHAWYKLITFIDSKLLGNGTMIVEKEVFVKDAAGNTVKSQVLATTDEAYGGFMSHYLHKALFFEIPAIHKNNVASVLVVLFILLCIWCYLQKKEDEEQWKIICFFAIASGMFIFFCFASPNPYWIVIMYPILYLLIFLHRDRIRANLLLINGFSLTLFVTYIVNYPHVYGGSSNLDYLLLEGLKKGIYEMDKGPQVYGYLNKLGINTFMSVIVAVCLATAIGLVAVNYPKTRINEGLSENDENRIFHGFVIWQLAVLAIWYVICVWAVSSW